MAKNNQNYVPMFLKHSIIKGILIGNDQTKTLTKKYQDDFKPEFMIRKLLVIFLKSSYIELKQQAIFAVELLQSLPENIPAKQLDRERILKEVYLLSKVTSAKV